MRKIIAMSFSLILLLSACLPALGGGNSTKEMPPPEVDIVATYVAQTKAAEPNPTEPPVQPTEPPVQPTETPEQPTAPPAPTAELITDANCRSGPGANFDNVVFLHAGNTGMVIGKNQQTRLWYLLELADGKKCWVTEDAVAITGNADGVANIASPATPTPKPPPNWKGTWNLWFAYSWQNTDMRYQKVAFTQSGNTLTFGFTTQEGTYFGFTGTVSADGMTVVGQFSAYGGPAQYSFALYRDPSNTSLFRGRYNIPPPAPTGTDGGICGNLTSATMPEPCKK